MLLSAFSTGTGTGTWLPLPLPFCTAGVCGQVHGPGGAGRHVCRAPGRPRRQQRQGAAQRRRRGAGHRQGRGGGGRGRQQGRGEALCLRLPWRHACSTWKRPAGQSSSELRRLPPAALQINISYQLAVGAAVDAMLNAPRLIIRMTKATVSGGKSNTHRAATPGGEVISVPTGSACARGSRLLARRWRTTHSQAPAWPRQTWWRATGARRTFPTCGPC